MGGDRLNSPSRNKPQLHGRLAVFKRGRSSWLGAAPRRLGGAVLCTRFVSHEVRRDAGEVEKRGLGRRPGAAGSSHVGVHPALDSTGSSMVGLGHIEFETPRLERWTGEAPARPTPRGRWRTTRYGRRRVVSMAGVTRESRWTEWVGPGCRDRAHQGRTSFFFACPHLADQEAGSGGGKVGESRTAPSEVAETRCCPVRRKLQKLHSASDGHRRNVFGDRWSRRG